MSHFMVAVMAKDQEDIGRLLEPYDENLEVEPYVQCKKGELLELAKEKQKRLLKAKEVLEPIEMKILKAETDEELYQAYREFAGGNYDEDGNEVTTYNPLTKWDWYMIGGRYSNVVAVDERNPDVIALGDAEIKDDVRFVDGARIKDIKFNKMQPTSEVNAIYHWELLNGIIEPKDEDEKMFLLFSNTADMYDDVHDYVLSETMFSPYAFIDSSGEWHERGSMGWFGMDDSTKEGRQNFEKEFLGYISSPEHQDEYMVIVDCHI